MSGSSYKNLLLLTPGSQDTPLFQVKNDKAQWVPFTDTRTRCNLQQIILRLGLCSASITFHTFRRSGAILTFNSIVSIQNIVMAPGCLCSEVYCARPQCLTASGRCIPILAFCAFSNSVVGHWCRLASTSFYIYFKQ